MDMFELYRNNVAQMYRHFDEYRTNARLFMASVPFGVSYGVSEERDEQPFMELSPVKSPIPLGALFLCWEYYPDLFTVETPNGTAMIFSFSGSPLSGRNSYSAVNLETGEIINGKDAPGFKERCKALNAAVGESDRMLSEFCAAKGIKREDFEPAGLEEVIKRV